MHRVVYSLTLIVADIAQIFDLYFFPVLVLVFVVGNDEFTFLSDFDDLGFAGIAAVIVAPLVETHEALVAHANTDLFLSTAPADLCSLCPEAVSGIALGLLGDGDDSPVQSAVVTVGDRTKYAEGCLTRGCVGH